MREQERDKEEEEDGDDDDEVFNGGFMKLLGCEEVVFEKREERSSSITTTISTRFIEDSEQGGFFFFSSPTTSSSSLSSVGPQMLHFGGVHEKIEEDFLTLMNGVRSGTDPSPPPPCGGGGKSRARARATIKKAKKVKNTRADTDGGTVAISKRQRGGSTTGINNKGRKEKIGDGISKLQQLVSPFGKSDTATVLHEAISYISFLHDQVQVLSSPYLQQPSASHQSDAKGEELMGDLKSRGLCLVPVSSTENMGGQNGADIWSPVQVQLR